MDQTIQYDDASVTVETLESGKTRLMVEPSSEDKIFIPERFCETTYPIDLIKNILDVKGPAYLCDEILREESPDYLQKNIEYDLLSYVNKDDFKGKRILELGSGSGASTTIMARLFPDSEIIGVELEDRNLSIARQRAKYYNLKNVTFLLSPNSNELPKDLGEVDYITLNAVYEHLLPAERKALLPALWNNLKPNGVIFIRETPYRYRFLEGHTTGLKLINFLPDKMAHLYANKYSKRNHENDSWDELLRKGIRGASVKEITGILRRCKGDAAVLDPIVHGIQDRIDLAYAKNNNLKLTKLRSRVRYSALKFLKALTGVQYVASLALAIRKDS